MSDLKTREGHIGGVKENVAQNALVNNKNDKTSEGWVTVQKKEKTEKQRFARKGRHGLAWRVPHDSTRGKKHLVKKQEKKKPLSKRKQMLNRRYAKLQADARRPGASARVKMQARIARKYT